MGDVRPPPPGAYGVQGAEENIIFPENEVTRKQWCQREESSLLAVTIDFKLSSAHQGGQDPPWESSPYPVKADRRFTFYHDDQDLKYLKGRPILDNPAKQ